MYVNFNMTAGTTPGQLQALLDVYNGTVVVPCVSYTDNTTVCQARFNSPSNGNAALTAANSHSLSGVSSAVVGLAPADSPSVDDDDGDLPWPVIVGIAAASVGALGVILVVVGRYVCSSSPRHVRMDEVMTEDSDEHYGMNMSTIHSNILANDEEEN